MIKSILGVISQSLSEFPNGTFADGNSIKDWGYRAPTTIQSSEVVADLTDYLFYVDLSSMPDQFFLNVNPDGGDIRVTRDDGFTELEHYVSYVDASSNQGALFIRYSGLLSSASNTTIYIYYDNPEASAYPSNALYGRDNTFQDYTEIFLFDSDPSLGTIESFGTAGRTLTLYNNNVVTQGRLPNGMPSYNLNHSAYILLGDKYRAQTSNLSYGIWVSNDDNSIARGIMGKMRVDFPEGAHGIYIPNGWPYYRSRFRKQYANGIVNGGNSTNGAWHKAVWRYQHNAGAGGWFGRINDTFGSSTTNVSSRAIGTNFTIGTDLSGGVIPNSGPLAVSFAWIKDPVAISPEQDLTEYNNQNSPNTFYTIGIIQK